MKTFGKNSYTAVPTAGETGSSESLEKQTRLLGRPRHLIQYLPWLIASIVALIVVGVVTFLQHSQPENTSRESCGNSSHEALSLGCSFDVISFAWLPERCFLVLRHIRTMRSHAMHREVAVTWLAYSRRHG